MKIYFSQFFPYVKVSMRLVQQLRLQKKYLQTELEPLLKEAWESNDGSLEESDFKKIRNYYALFVVAIVGENYCRLRGKTMTERERKVLTYQGALTGLYDDFFDHEKRKGRDILAMMNAPFTYVAKDSVEKLFLYFLQQVHSHLENKEEFNRIFAQIYDVQQETEMQINSTLNAQELKLISEKKGGLSHLFYRVTLSNNLLEGEQEAIYELGSLLQQVNDIFDVWKDRTAGISTFASKSNDMKNTKVEFEKQMQKVYSLVNKLNYSAQNKRDFFLQFMILIGMGMVSLNQYIQLQEKNNSKFEVEHFTRHELVCDMQKKSNLYKLMRVCLSYDFKWSNA